MRVWVVVLKAALPCTPAEGVLVGGKEVEVVEVVEVVISADGWWF